MGLDVSLYHYKNLIEAERMEEKYQDESEEIWKEIRKERDYDDLTEKERSLADCKCRELAMEMGLGKYGESSDGNSIRIDSELYPEHLFKIGYFRSSYNPGGVNSVLSRMSLPDLYYIFPHEDVYQFIPIWNDSLKRVEEVLSLFKSCMDTDIGKYDASFVHPIAHNGGVKSEVEALKLFRDELQEHRKSGTGKRDAPGTSDSYSSSKGEFYLGEGLVVYGMIFGSRYSFESNGVYIIYKRDDLLWYLHALEIVVETINYVLNNPVEVGDYVLHWSG